MLCVGAFAFCALVFSRQVWALAFICVSVLAQLLASAFSAFFFRAAFAFLRFGASVLVWLLASAFGVFILCCKYLQAQLSCAKVSNLGRTKRCTRPLKAPFNSVAHRKVGRGAFSAG